MTPVMQTVICPTRGNCMQASVASLLDMELKDVPNWIELPEDEWQMIFLDWLEEQGYQFMGERDDEEEMLDPHYGVGVDGHLIVKGTSPRGFGKGHMVVYKNGKLAHDPHPSGLGVGKVQAFWMIERKEQ